ncbi:hypothetical protein J3Q64DRAFT_1177982 [Phycomyces blakesleeanus]|uniref:Uncharacterized protein n=1 Tax=Phycomyces blakesleeanus TaxID=4837 RepID=A0ABR3ATX5_PHYBL
MRHPTSESEVNTPNRRSSDNSSLMSETSVSQYRPSMVSWKANMNNTNASNSNNIIINSNTNSNNSNNIPDDEISRMRSMSTHSPAKMKHVNYPKSRKHSHESINSTSPSERSKNNRPNTKQISSVDCLTEYKENININNINSINSINNINNVGNVSNVINNNSTTNLAEGNPVVQNVMGLGKRSRLLNPEPSEEKIISGKSIHPQYHPKSHPHMYW